MNIVQLYPRRVIGTKENIKKFRMKAWGKNPQPIKTGFNELNITDEAVKHFLPESNPLFYVSKTYSNGDCFRREAAILQKIQTHFYNKERGKAYQTKRELPFTPLLLESDSSIKTNYLSYCGSLLRGDIKKSKLQFGNKPIRVFIDNFDAQINDIFETLDELNIGCDRIIEQWNRIYDEKSESKYTSMAQMHNLYEKYGLHRRGIEFTYDEYNNKLMIIDVENWSLTGENKEVWEEAKKLIKEIC